jgi:hypothetical protein
MECYIIFYIVVFIYICDYIYVIIYFFSKEESINFIYTKKIYILNNALEIVHLV